MKKKLLFLSDSPTTTTGYATVCRNVSNQLAQRGWEVHVIGHNYLGQTLQPFKFEDGTECNFTLHGTGREQYAKDIIVPKIRELKPDVFVTLLDTFMVFPWFLDLDFAPAKTSFYFPSDGGGQFPTGCENILRRMNLPIAMAEFGQKQLKEVHGVDTEFIPHGVDENLFYPLNPNEKNHCKNMFGVANKFVVGVVARNQGRKMLDRTIKAFAQFCKKRPDAVLLMHTDPYDNAQVFNMTGLIARYGIQNRVFFTGTNFYKGFDYTEMNQVYNAMDVFLLTTSGEGFGIPIIEAMAAKVPVVATNYTTTKELVTDNLAGLSVRVAAEITGSWEVERGIADIDNCVEALDALYEDPEGRKIMGDNGRKAVLQKYTWDIVGEKFDKLFTEMITNE